MFLTICGGGQALLPRAAAVQRPPLRCLRNGITMAAAQPCQFVEFGGLVPSGTISARVMGDDEVSAGA